MGICNKFSYAGASFILAGFMDLTNVRLEDTIMPFYLITCIFIILGVLSYFSPLPEIKPDADGERPVISSDYANSKTSILQFPHLLLGVLALFFDMGLETIALGTINDYATFLELSSPENYVWLTSAGMIIGYLLGIVLIPRFMSQNTALMTCSLLGLLIIPLISVFPTSTSICLVAFLGLANSLLWPTIWPLAIADLGKYTHVGSSLLVVAMIGGAVLPLLFGFLADVTSYSTAYWVCFPAYLFILYFAQCGSKIRTPHFKIN
jgi:fucose permease